MTPGSFHSKVWLARHRVDFRKGHSGLLAECYKMGIDPYKGNLVIFIGRHRRRIKIVYADPTGLWVNSKVFTMEAMKTSFKLLDDPGCDSITSSEFSLLIEGSSYIIKKRVATYTKVA
ncbi:MAG: IS66 family insertion sequence element accessory protein TnpB [Bdellovibrionaceae bacterium]|nr:IS66 family insertion sequence element accessory protein TnpB [Pseudobdellovibrionaceae bacterium]